MSSQYRRELLIGPDISGSVRQSVERVELAVDQATDSHSHPEEEICYALSGRGMLYGGGEPVYIDQNVAVYLAPGLEHWVENTGESPLRFVSLLCGV